MSLYGKFIAYCNNCGKKLLTEAGGHGMWKAGGVMMVCGKECHDEMDVKYTRSILGKDTPEQHEKET